MCIYPLFCNISAESRVRPASVDHKPGSTEEQRQAEQKQKESRLSPASVDHKPGSTEEQRQAEQEQKEAEKEMRNKAYMAALIGTVAFIICVGLALFMIYKQIQRARRSSSQTSNKKYISKI